MQIARDTNVCFIHLRIFPFKMGIITYIILKYKVVYKIYVMVGTDGKYYDA